MIIRVTPKLKNGVYRGLRLTIGLENAGRGALVPPVTNGAGQTTPPAA